MSHLVLAAHHVLADALPMAGPTSGTGGFTDPNPAPPPGMQGTFTNWISWAKYLGMVAGAIGLIACGIMMMIGRRNRSHLAAEGAGGVVWVIAGISTVTLAVSVVTSMMG